MDFASNSDEAVLTVRGEIDTATAPDLAALVEAAIEQGHRRVVLDLGNVDFLGAAGIGVIASVAARLTSTGGADLVIGAPSPGTFRLLGLLGLLEVVRVEGPALEAAGSAPIHAGAHGDGVAAGDAALPGPDPASSGKHVLDAALGLVVALAQATVPGADGVTITLGRHGRLATVATSDDVVSFLDAVQYDSGEGPCVAASTEGRAAYIESVPDEARWPAFTSRARPAAMGSVLSTPLITPASAPGALNLYSRTPRAFAPREKELAAILATEVSTLVTAAQPDGWDDRRRNTFHRALATREVIAQAQGVLIQQEGLARHEAYAVLREQSHQRGIPLGRWAEKVVATAEHRRPASHARENLP